MCEFKTSERHSVGMLAGILVSEHLNPSEGEMMSLLSLVDPADGSSASKKGWNTFGFHFPQAQNTCRQLLRVPMTGSTLLSYGSLPGYLGPISDVCVLHILCP